jgi:hypothetical protein
MKQLKGIDHQQEEIQRPLEIFHADNLVTKEANIISEAANPLFVAAPTFLLISLKTAPTLSQGVLWWMITVVGISAAPFLFILQGVRRGKYTDRHVSLREQRLVPLLFGISCVIAVFILLLLLHASRAMIATITAVIIALILATVVTRYWKISFHLVGIAGAVTAITLLFGPFCLLLTPLVVIVAWARWQVHAHTLLQALAGITLAVSVTIAIFTAFGLL